MILKYDCLDSIYYSADPTMEDLQRTIYQLDHNIQKCHENIKEIANNIERIVKANIADKETQLIASIYDVLHDLKYIEVTREEFISLIKETKKQYGW